MLSYPIKKHSNDACIQQIYKHSANDRYNQKWLYAIMVFIAHCTHVGHSVRRSTQPKATDARYQHCRIIVAPQNAESHKISEQGYQDNLRKQNNQQG